MNTSSIETVGSRSNPVDISVLTKVLAASNDACWCMEFDVPVDLTAPDQEVVRQIFENDPRWRLTNPAMAQLYILPPGQNFEDRLVSEIFPRNALNEEFVLNLIANGFEVDATPALDTRYDGVEICVENDVRAHIENGRLLRMFGIVRDVGKHRRREAALQLQLNNSLLVLDSIPTSVFAIAKEGSIIVVNTAAERLVSLTQDELIGQNFKDIVQRGMGSSIAEVLGKEIAALIDAGIPSSKLIKPPSSKLNWSISTRSGTEAIAVVISANEVIGDIARDD